MPWATTPSPRMVTPRPRNRLGYGEPASPGSPSPKPVTGIRALASGVPEGREGGSRVSGGVALHVKVAVEVPGGGKTVISGVGVEVRVGVAVSAPIWVAVGVGVSEGEGGRMVPM